MHTVSRWIKVRLASTKLVRYSSYYIAHYANCTYPYLQAIIFHIPRTSTANKHMIALPQVIIKYQCMPYKVIYYPSIYADLLSGLLVVMAYTSCYIQRGLSVIAIAIIIMCKLINCKSVWHSCIN